MRAARLHGPGDIRIGDEPEPMTGPGTSLVRVEAVGLCGSDLHWFRDAAIGAARLEGPVVPGHEFGGVVIDGPLTGRRVTVDPAIACELCESCRAGHRNLCPNVDFAGHGSLDGGLKEFVTWPSHLLHPLPGSFTPVQAALIEPLGVALHAYDRGHVRPDCVVAVVGCGPIGLLLIQLARAHGAGRVVAVEIHEHRREAARRAGADIVFSPDEARDTWTRRLLPVDVAFEAGGTDDAIDLALHAVRPGARIVLVGIPEQDHSGFQASLARRKGVTMVMSRRMGDVYARAVSLVDHGRVDLDSLVTHRYPLAEAARAFDDAASRVGVKTLVDIDA